MSTGREGEGAEGSLAEQRALRGLLRSALTTFWSLQHLLRSPQASAKQVGQLLPGALEEARRALDAARALAKVRPGPLGPGRAALELFSERHVAQLIEVLEAAQAGPFNTVRRLALERALAELGPSLATANRLGEYCDGVLAEAPQPSAIAPLIEGAFAESPRASQVTTAALPCSLTVAPQLPELALGGHTLTETLALMATWCGEHPHGGHLALSLVAPAEVKLELSHGQQGPAVVKLPLLLPLTPLRPVLESAALYLGWTLELGPGWASLRVTGAG